MSSNRPVNGDSEPGRAEVPPSTGPMWLALRPTTVHSVQLQITLYYLQQR
ncbi:hypothetical protein [Actinomadura alba]|uniref:Uncharacterized protein n=1 Tax=Actinomadura alba TaxID=406431 RepID=A0ABR7LZZ0_9ACTN|nr:hypothetical protein [Actinomadura alba]MBC6470431.1 hypothetical protein [Actinomadura alba]